MIYMRYVVLLLLLICNVSFGMAEEAVVDIRKAKQDMITMSSYFTKIGTFMNQIAKTSNTNSQLTNIRELIKTQQDIMNICGKTCSSNDLQTIENYIQRINSGIITRFDLYANNDKVNTMDDLARLLDAPLTTTDIGISLQKANQATLEEMNGTLQQIQVTMLLNAQKQQSEELREKAIADSVYAGLGKSGL